MARFKVGTRIAAGFSIVLFLLAILVFLSYNAGNQAAYTLSEYGRVAHNAVQIGQVNANVGNLRRLVISYANDNSESSLDGARQMREKIHSGLQQLIEHTRDATRKQRYVQLEETLNAYSKNIENLAIEAADKRRIYTDELNIYGPKMREMLNDLLQHAMSQGAYEAAAHTGIALESLMQIRMSVLRYVVEPDAEMAAATRAHLTEFKARAEALERYIGGNDAKTVREVTALADRYIASFAQFQEHGELIHQLVAIEMPVQAKTFGEVSDAALKAAQERMVEEQTLADQNTLNSQIRSVLLGILALGIGVLAAVLIAMGITRPVHQMCSAMGQLAAGDLETEVPATDYQDEIGEMAQAVQVFKENAQRVRRMEAEQKEAERRAAEEKHRMMNALADSFQESVGHVVETVSSAATELEATAQTMAAIAEETERQSTAVAEASEQASENVQTVASAAEELSSSISEIGRQVQHSSEITSRAAEKAAKTHQVMKGLSDSASQIGDVVNMITDIAEQTNLLALNATIEAARAGDAGKGFAVVANEVKNLANQTGRATEEISRQIASVQSETHAAVAAIDEIVGIIENINEVAASIASAVEQQNAATQEIARNVEQAAAGTSAVSSNIQGVTQAAGEAGAASEQVVSASQELAQNASILRQEVASFVDRVRSA